MNVVFLSPNFPPQFHLFCRALRRHGIHVFGVGDCPRESLPPETADAVNDYVQIHESRYEDLLRATGYLTWRHGKIDVVESLNEFWLGWEAQLRDDFNIAGPKGEQMARFRSKTGMREIFRAAGVPCTDGERVSSPEQVRAFVRQHGFPLVFKPDVGVGAAWTFKVDDDEELERALLHPLPGYVVERFCKGRLCSFDGLTGPDGKIVFVVSHEYSSGVMEMVNEARDVYYFTRREIPARLEELGRKVVSAFGLSRRFFHIEFFEEGDDYRALEINVRPPGGFTTDMFNYACDIDIYDLWARSVAGHDLSGFTYERKYYCAYASRRFGRTYRLLHHEVIEKLGPALVTFREMPPVLSGAMGNLMYLVRYEQQEPMREALAAVMDRG